MAFHHKKFQNFNIKTLTIIACPNCCIEIAISIMDLWVVSKHMQKDHGSQ